MSEETEKDRLGFWGAVWKSKLYIFLAIFLSFLFVINHLSEDYHQEKKASREQTVRVQEKIKQAEASLKEEMREKGSVEEFLKDNPTQAQLVNYATLLFIVIFLYGLWIDGWCLIRKSHHKPLLATLDFVQTPKWQVFDVFKIMLLFLFFSTFIGLIGDVAGHLAPNIFNANGKLILHGTVADFVALGLVLYFSKVKYGQSFFKIQIRKENILKDIGIAFNAYLALFPIIILLLLLLVWVVSLFQYEPPPQKLVEVFVEESKENPFIVGYGMFLASFVGPALEEVFFRGFFYSALRKSYSAVPAALVTAVFFSFLHYSAFAFLPIFFLSLILTYLYEKTKSLVAPITFHIFHNMIFLGYFFLMKQSFLDKFLH